MEFSTLIFEPHVDLKLPPVPVPFIDVVFSEIQKIDLVDPLSTSAPLPFAISSLIQSEVVSGRLLTRGDDVKETFELSLDIKEAFSYLPGDSVGIFAQNSLEEVDQLLKCLGLHDQKNSPIEIVVKSGVKKKLPLYLPPVSTPKIVLESVLEIRGVMKKGFLRSLAEYTADSKEKRRLLELSSQEGAAEYNKYFLQQGWTLSDVLTELRSCVPPLPLLLEQLPRLLPRAYSIASAPSSGENKINIVFNLVVTPRGKPGVCSSWLKNKCENFDDLSKKFEKMGIEDSSTNFSSKTIPLFFRKPSNFRIPSPMDAPLILIGPGTGVAPFVGFIEHISLQEKNISDGLKDTILVYFGCRYRNRDHIYKEEMEDFVSRKFISEYRVCHSRDRLQESDPKYVQDLLYVDKENVCDLITRGAFVFVCGDATNMAKDVQAILVKILHECSDMTADGAEQLISQLEKNGKFVKDVWRCLDETIRLYVDRFDF
ncbi:hypothetical protein GE061_006409 [Apolygus lucorum]|uniref:Methionine synthase reductase n=1 Tax=Apolygus lucorum TaxID=248454 RepID=A0A8S9WVH8_APOLU|nr:hypothetical protein GE061_006409 [Apolygus lucorum]